MTSEEKKKKVAQTNKIVSKFGDPWKNFKSVYDKYKNHATYKAWFTYSFLRTYRCPDCGKNGKTVMGNPNTNTISRGFGFPAPICPTCHTGLASSNSTTAFLNPGGRDDSSPGDHDGKEFFVTGAILQNTVIDLSKSVGGKDAPGVSHRSVGDLPDKFSRNDRQTPPDAEDDMSSNDDSGTCTSYSPTSDGTQESEDSAALYGPTTSESEESSSEHNSHTTEPCLSKENSVMELTKIDPSSPDASESEDETSKRSRSSSRACSTSLSRSVPRSNTSSVLGKRRSRDLTVPDGQFGNLLDQFLDPAQLPTPGHTYCISQEMACISDLFDEKDKLVPAFLDFAKCVNFLKDSALVPIEDALGLVGDSAQRKMKKELKPHERLQALLKHLRVHPLKFSRDLAPRVNSLAALINLDPDGLLQVLPESSASARGKQIVEVVHSKILRKFETKISVFLKSCSAHISQQLSEAKFKWSYKRIRTNFQYYLCYRLLALLSFRRAGVSNLVSGMDHFPLTSGLSPAKRIFKISAKRKAPQKVPQANMTLPSNVKSSGSQPSSVVTTCPSGMTAERFFLLQGINPETHIFCKVDSGASHHFIQSSDISKVKNLRPHVVSILTSKKNSESKGVSDLMSTHRCELHGVTCRLLLLTTSATTFCRWVCLRNLDLKSISHLKCVASLKSLVIST